MHHQWLSLYLRLVVTFFEKNSRTCDGLKRQTLEIFFQPISLVFPSCQRGVGYLQNGPFWRACRTDAASRCCETPCAAGPLVIIIIFPYRINLHFRPFNFSFRLLRTDDGRRRRRLWWKEIVFIWFSRSSIDGVQSAAHHAFFQTVSGQRNNETKRECDKTARAVAGHWPPSSLRRRTVTKGANRGENFRVVEDFRN